SLRKRLIETTRGLEHFYASVIAADQHMAHRLTVWKTSPQSIQLSSSNAKTIILTLCLIPLLATSGATQAITATPELAPSDIQEITTKHILSALREQHYVDQVLDDGVSEEVFDRYIEDLDPSKSYLTQADVAALSQYRWELDNSLRRSDLGPAFDIFNRYQAKVTARFSWVIELIDQGVDQFDFDKEEYLELDRSELPFAPSETALDELWRKRIKNDVLNLKLAGKSFEDIQSLLHKRYSSRLSRLQKTNQDDVYQLFMNAFAKTYDPHTQYFSPITSENFNINMSLSLEGIGALLQTEDEYTKVVSLVPAGPAEKSKSIRPNDRIIGVGQENDEIVDIIGWRVDDVVQLIRGKRDTSVFLQILPEGSSDLASSKVVEIVRKKVELEEQTAQAEVVEIEQFGNLVRIGVIDIPTFYVDFKAMQNGDPNFRSTTRDVKRLLDELQTQDVDGVVIDLRDNGGGSLQEAKTLTGLFIDRGPTVQIRSKANRVDVLSDRDVRTSYRGPLAVLVNRLSASASEIFAGAIQDYQRGLVIGTQTFGKGTVQTLQPLEYGQLKMTQAKFYRITGDSTQHRGIIPDLRYPDDYDPEAIGESTLDDPLPWDQIRPTYYRAKGDIQAYLPELVSRHEARILEDPEFNYVIEAFKYRQLRADDTQLSLRESERIQEKSDNESFWLALTNTKRAAQGLPAVASLEELNEQSDDADIPTTLGDTESISDFVANGGINSELTDVSEDGLSAPSIDLSGAAQDANQEEELQGADAEENAPPDAYIVEAGNVLADLISLQKRTAQQSPARAPI
ncbi:MAG: hypothetical protein EBY55_09320, partial [Gammaproteobacteria bacterium]|nr:hypothetical protein [Gammaproteobacteria bacterium]